MQTSMYTLLQSQTSCFGVTHSNNDLRKHEAQHDSYAQLEIGCLMNDTNKADMQAENTNMQTQKKETDACTHIS